MHTIDRTASPTPFQMRVLRILRAIGPCPLAELSRHCNRPAEAVRLAVWILRDGGFVRRDDDGLYDVTPAARLALTAVQPRRTLLERLAALLSG